MKFAFVVLLLLNISYAHGQQRMTVRVLTNILLRLAFPSFYNSNPKSCCKMYPGVCYLLVNSNGDVCDILRGRVTQSHGDGWVQFTISNAQFSDRGFYRCQVTGTPIYSDFYVEIQDRPASDDLPSLQSTTKVFTNLGPTQPVMEQDLSDPSRQSWSFLLPTVVSMAAMICISTLTALVFCCVRAKQKQSSIKHSESPLTDTDPEISAIVYTAVDFKAHQKPTEIYENWREPKKQESHHQHSEHVEYSALALQQHP